MSDTFFTQAGNFISTLRTLPDPRTGQFLVNLPLVNLVANNQLGPDLALSLSYSPLTGSNYGFGIGFSLGFTRFSNHTNLLELSNGEKYRVEPGTDTVRNQKLSNFRFAYTNGTDDAEGYTVFWKEGKQERLTLTGDDTFVSSLILSPLGRTLTLAWDWNGQQPLLTQVSDESSPLAQFRYDSAVVTLTVWPGTADEYQVTFSFINDQLDTVSRQVSDSETLTWSFSYDSVDGAGHLLLTGVDYPTGMKDRVEYSQIAGLAYPDASGISIRLPAVLSHRRNPGAGQPETVTYYTWTEQNFLGYNGNFGDWSADSDYIYTTLTDYVYGSTESTTDGDVTVTTTRTYNNYHLQLSEEIIREGCRYRTDFTYYAEADTFIDGQPPQFQLPKQKTETWTDAQGKSRAQVTVSEFDESGNPVRQVSPDGTETVTEWYSAAGETGCPAEPHGFVRFMKSQATTPRATDYDAPVMLTRYTYITASDEAHVVQDTLSTFADGMLLSRRDYAYNTDAGNPEYGRIIAIRDTKYDGGEGSDCFTSRLDFSTAVSDGVMRQTTVFTGHDGLQTSTIHVQSALSGLLLSETDVQGVTVTHAYDKTGRPLTRTVAPGTEYENTRAWSYVIEADGPVTTETDASSNSHKLHFDGAGRNVRLQRLDTDDTQQWYNIATRTYNALGEVATGNGRDWLTAAGVQYDMQVALTADAWGSVSRQTFTDGITNVLNADPVGLTRSTSVQGQGVAGSAASGTYTSALDAVSQLPVTDTRTDLAGSVVGTRHRRWDGAGRLREETDERDNVTSRTYDAYGRVLTQTLPDGSVVTRTYAPHLADKSVASISVTGPDADGNMQTWQLGTQTFDSLGRVRTRTCGGRTTTYVYGGASPAPSDIILPSGKILQYTYIPELGNVVSSLTADGVTQTFTYDATTGDQLTATEGETESVSAWFLSGNLKAETFTRDGEVRSTARTVTLGGEPVSYTDITGALTTYTRDNYGRLTGITDDALSVSLGYDALGRLSMQAVTDIGTQNALTTGLAYDDFGQEITRTVTDVSSAFTLTVSQTWLPEGLLQSRTTWLNGTTVKAETYNYDNRNRLTSYQVSGSCLPSDAYGHEMAAQTYEYDALNNLTAVTTTLADDGSDTATYHYDNADDPTQLTSVTHTHDGYPQSVALKYDANGYMTHDEAGRTLGYDVTGRLVSVSGDGIRGGHYGYDALNQLVSQGVSDEDRRQLYYRGNELVSEVLTQQSAERRWIKSGHTTLGISTGDQLTLTAGDGNDSLMWSHTSTENAGSAHAWSPYGNGKPEDGLPGFNGECADPVSGTYHLGNGYRAYNPVLMRFNCPDSLSPFGAGGINAYAYCSGDPVNHTDPSGHMSWQAITGIVAGTIGVALAVFTAGASIAAAGGVMAALGAASASSLVVGVLGVAADVTAIASGAVEESNPHASSVLGWVSMGLGLVGIAEGAGRLGIKGLKRVKAVTRQRLGNISADGAFYKTFHLEEMNDISRETYYQKLGFTNNFRNTGEPGILMHGTAQGKISFVDGLDKPIAPWARTSTDFIPDSYELTVKEFVSFIKERHSVDLSKFGGDTPLHFVACYGGTPIRGEGYRSMAQQLADVTGRRVYTYGGIAERVLDTSTSVNRGLEGLYKSRMNFFSESTGKKLNPVLLIPHSSMA